MRAAGADDAGPAHRACGSVRRAAHRDRQSLEALTARAGCLQVRGDCDLHLTCFGPGRYRGCDPRGNDLSALTGIPHLRHVIIDRAQMMQLGEALKAELDVSFGDHGVPDRR